MKRLVIVMLVLFALVPGLRGQGYKSYTDIRYGEKRAELKVDDPTQDRLLDIYIPETAKPASGYPVLMFIHGGGFSGGSKDMKVTVQNIFEKLLANGYAVVSVNYILGNKKADQAVRQNGGQRQSRDGQQARGQRPERRTQDGNEQEYLQDRQRQQRPRQEGQRETGGPDDALLAPGPGSPMLMAGEDAVMALQWLDAHAAEYGLDMDFVALMGGSAGSATCICAAHYLHPDKPRVAALVNCWGGFNALDAIKDGSIPMLTFHGTDDRTIPIAQGYALQKKMEELGNKQSRMVVMEGKGHAEYRYIGQEKMEEIVRFLNEVRGEGNAPVVSEPARKALGRKVLSLNEGWQFSPRMETTRTRNIGWGEGGEGGGRATVNLPHTWNAADFMEDGGYRRGWGTYTKRLDIPADYEGKRVFLRFEGAGSMAVVFVNNKYVGEHKGPYNSFTFEITDFVTPGADNTVMVQCNNERRYDIAPQGGDFNLYGGLYRDAWMEVTEPQCISPLYYGTHGMFIHQNVATAERAELRAEIYLTTLSDYKDCVVRFAVKDASGKEVAVKHSTIINNDRATCTVGFDNPHLWNGKDDPYLYTAVVTLLKDGREIDRVEENIGIRSFWVDPDKGFFLNGKHLKLRGVCRHQDWSVLASALTKENHITDYDFFDEIGANSLRLAHYPQAHFMFEEADRRGYVVWEEIPFVGSYMNSPEFDDNLRLQLKEMILQNYNHPSICFWGLYNEIRDDIEGLVAELNDLAHELDPGRLTVAATHVEVPYNHTPDGIGWNKYFGWYYDTVGDFGPFLNQWHAQYPNARIAISEYGGGASLNQHVSTYGVKDEVDVRSVSRGQFHPMEKQSYLHYHDWMAIAERDFVWGSFVWNMFDFAAANRHEGDTPNQNDKGLVTHDRKTRKDAFYFYKANWNKAEKTAWLCSKNFTERDEAVTDIVVFTTAPSATLYLNGKKVGSKKADTYATVRWDGVTLAKGENTVEVRTAHGNDSAKWIVK